MCRKTFSGKSRAASTNLFGIGRKQIRTPETESSAVPLKTKKSKEVLELRASQRKPKLFVICGSKEFKFLEIMDGRTPVGIYYPNSVSLNMMI